MNKQLGIYIILNLENGKFYIGSSMNIYLRLCKHKTELRSGRHVNDYLQKSWNKYGEQAFLFKEIEYCKIDDLISREQYWLNFHQTFKRDIGYNILEIANSSLGYKHTEENKFVLKEIARVKWENMTAEEDRLERERLSSLRKGVLISKEHYKKLREGWEKADVPNNPKRIEASKKANFEKISKPLIQFDREGNFINEFHNSIIASKSLGVKDHTSINKACQGKRKSAHGFVWKYKNSNI